MPHLKIGFRKGVDNGLADLLCRFPTFRRFATQRSDVVSLPARAVLAALRTYAHSSGSASLALYL